MKLRRSKSKRSNKHLPLSEVLATQLDQKTGLPPDTDRESQVKAALLQRPRFSVKTRLAVLFLILFLAAAGVSTATWVFLSEIESSTRLVAVSDVVANEIQQARRYEKNYFLYRSDLPLILQHVSNAEELLRRAADDMRSVVGTNEIAAFRNDIDHYRNLVEELTRNDSRPDFQGGPEFHQLETALRDRGAKMISLALDISTKERQQISSLIALTKNISIILLIVLLTISLYTGFHISRHIIVRLSRLMEATQRIAAGDFSPILPRRKYRDEFSNLAIALNHMMYELERRQEVLVESHKMRAVGNLTAGVAHELNNPLNNIMLTAEMLDEDFDTLSNEERKEMIRDIVTQADRGRGVVKNLLDFARESKAKVEHLPVKELIDETVRLAGNQMRLNKIKLQLDIDGGISPIYGDRSLLQQVFLNLILNAIDAMPNGGHLFIRASPEEDTGFVAVHMSDTGVGIPSHLLRSIFDPFFTTKTTGKGTGLGLAVSQGIVNNHGGEIEVMSKVGVGTTFTVHLPTLPVPASFATANEEAEDRTVTENDG